MKQTPRSALPRPLARHHLAPPSHLTTQPTPKIASFVAPYAARRVPFERGRKPNLYPGLPVRGQGVFDVDTITEWHEKRGRTAGVLLHRLALRLECEPVRYALCVRKFFLLSLFAHVFTSA